jgi:hypothetical protein
MAFPSSAALRQTGAGHLSLAETALAFLALVSVAASLWGGPSLRLHGPGVPEGFATAYQDERPGSWRASALAALAAADSRMPPGRPYCFEFAGGLAHPSRLGSRRWRPLSYAIEWLQFSLQPRRRQECGPGVAAIVFAEPRRMAVP